ncbi:WecB/TagA/CpsF family glycosyltransferase [Hyphococcus sp.]|uniref:WecB/TagA/CpsF family glycosyltransferase n=1 Tax=Hyphococcus sp. TaxID=2038636 RepID=UPI003CCC2708
MAEPNLYSNSQPDMLDAGRSDDRTVSFERDDFDRDVWCLMGLPVDIADIDRAVASIDRAVRDGARLSFVTPNVNFLVRALRDQKARREIINADLSLVDGAPLVAMAKLLGVPVTSRVAGSDLFEVLRRRPGFSGRKLRVFFFGGRDGAAEAAANAVNKEKGGIEAAGFYNPGHGDVDSMSTDAIIERINETSPDFVMVALGAAKGQAWIERNRDRLTAPITAHLGAVVDFTAGGVARAPRWMQRTGLEWAWRIKEEPSLWKRYFLDARALLMIAATRLAPQMTGRRKSGGTKPAAFIERTAGSVEIILSGDLTHGALRPVRDAFRTAAAEGRPVCLNFTKVLSFDRAFLGLVLMLEKNLAAKAAQISLKGLAKAQNRTFRANNMIYSTGGDSDHGHAADMPPARQAAV